jgi:hypothetical protein
MLLGVETDARLICACKPNRFRRKVARGGVHVEDEIIGGQEYPELRVVAFLFRRL